MNSINTSFPAYYSSFRGATIQQISTVQLASFYDFDSLTSLLSPSRKNALLTEIAQLPDLQAGIDQVLTLADYRNYDHVKEFFLSTNFELYAFAAVKERKLSSMQFGTIMFTRAALSEDIGIEDFEVISLYTHGAVNPKAWDQIWATIKVDEGNPIIDKNALATFFEKMRLLPESEQGYILIPDTRPTDISRRTISQSINQDVAFNIFCGLNVDGQKKRMLFSLGMAQTFIDVSDKTDQNPVLLKFVVTLSKPENLRHSMIRDSAREFCISTDRFPTPPRADSFDAPPLDFMYHDFYHGFACGCIPRRHRLFYSEIASVFNPNLYDGRAAKNIAQHFYETLIDLDFTRYRTDYYGQIDDRTLFFNFKNILEIVVMRSKIPIFPAYSKQEQEESKSLSKQMKSTLSAYFCLWMIYYRNYDFRVTIDAFERLPLDVQATLGDDFLEIFEKLRSLYPELIKKIYQINPTKMSNFREIASKHFIALTMLSDHILLDEIFDLTPEFQKVLLDYHYFFIELFKLNIPLHYLANIKIEIVLFISRNAGRISTWLKQGLKFTRLVELLNQWFSYGIEEKKFYAISNFVQYDQSFDRIILLRNKLPLFVRYERYILELLPYGLSLSKIVNANFFALESLFKFIDEHRNVQLPSERQIRVQQLMKAYPEIKSMIMDL